LITRPTIESVKLPALDFNKLVQITRMFTGLDNAEGRPLTSGPDSSMHERNSKIWDILGW
jgi:hypothetical protein